MAHRPHQLTTYGDCLLAGAKALAEENDARVGSKWGAEEIAAEVWARADYAELSEQVARRVREELQG